jgi:hypothetical protein
LTSALDGGEWSVSHPVRFTPRERAPGTHWIRGKLIIKESLKVKKERQKAFYMKRVKQTITGHPGLLETYR